MQGPGPKGSQLLAKGSGLPPVKAWGTEEGYRRVFKDWTQTDLAAVELGGKTRVAEKLSPCLKQKESISSDTVSEHWIFLQNLNSQTHLTSVSWLLLLFKSL